MLGIVRKQACHLLDDLQHSLSLPVVASVICVRVFCDTDCLISIVEFPDHTILVSSRMPGDHSLAWKRRSERVGKLQLGSGN